MTPRVRRTHLPSAGLVAMAMALSVAEAQTQSRAVPTAAPSGSGQSAPAPERPIVRARAGAWVLTVPFDGQTLSFPSNASIEVAKEVSEVRVLLRDEQILRLDSPRVPFTLAGLAPSKPGDRYTLAVKAAASGQVFEQAVVVVPAEPGGVPAPESYRFVSFREYDGNKDVTERYWERAVADRSAAGTLYVDERHIIHVTFDEDVLTQGIRRAVERAEQATPPGTEDVSSFFASGQLSLAAFIGERAIEVEGYSEVGKNRSKVGSTGMPVHRFLLDMRQLQLDLIGLKRRTLASEDYLELARRTAVILRSFLDDESTSEAVFLAMRVSPQGVRSVAARLESALKPYPAELEQATERDRVGATEREENIQKAEDELQALALKSRESRSESMRTLAGLESDIDRLKSARDQKRAANEPFGDEESGIAKKQAELSEAKTRALEQEADDAHRLERAKEKVRTVRQPERATVPEKYRPAVSQVVADLFELLASEPCGIDPKACDPPSPSLDEALNAYWDHNRVNRVVHELYRNLVDGRIVLEKAGARTGDVVRVDLLVYHQGVQEPVGFTIGRFLVGDYGWHRSVVDSFLLIKRGKEPAGKDTSNFKGAGGASLLWSCETRPERKECPWPRWLSVGVNISYLDFDPDKEFEVGAGAILGLFGNMLHVGAGLNLNTPGNLGDRFYYFVGFSFIGLAERWQTGKGGGAVDPGRR